MALPLPAIIAAGGALASTGLGALASHRAARRARRFSRQQIAEMNEYNHPAQQMQRLRDAGLNPMLMYGQGSPGQQTEVAPAQYSAAVPDASQAIDSFYETEQSRHNVMIQKQMWWLKNTQRQIQVSQRNVQQMEEKILEATFDERIEKELAESIIKQAQAVVNEKYAEWASQGINPRDATWIRVTIEILEAMGISVERIRKIFGGLNTE